MAGLATIESRVIRGRTITAADVAAVQRLMLEQPQAGRTDLARALCAHWQWRASSGRWKVRSALAILTELERQGWIGLPTSQTGVGRKHRPAMAAPEGSRLDGPLGQYRPLRYELVCTTAQRRQWRDLLAQHHYLGAPQLVGANLKYLVYGRGGELLGALGWQSAVQHLGCWGGMRPSGPRGWSTSSTGFVFWCYRG